MRPKAKLFLPKPVLASCVFAGIYRDTRGSSLSDQDRINHFPASPIVTVTRVFHGELFLMSQPSREIEHLSLTPLPGLSVAGPQDTPTTSWSPGEISALTIGFYYDAWMQLGGSADFKTIPKTISNALNGLGHRPDIAQDWDAFASALLANWKSGTNQPPNSTRAISDWSRSLLTRAALSTAGRSIRSLERRIRRDSGQTRRTLDFYSSMEDAHRQISQSELTSPADFALEAGFSDQSHMGRAVRRLTGFSPADLNRAIETEEPFWCYRLLGERF